MTRTREMASGSSSAARNRPDDSGNPGRVLYFRRRGPDGLPLAMADPERAGPEPLSDLSRYEQPQDDHVDYRRRTIMNVIALAVVALLVGAGVWIADTITDLQRDQDCVLQGRGNCAPIEAPGERP